MVDVNHLDIQQAFAKVSHQRFPAQVKSYGIDGAGNRWLKKCLTGKEQRAVINNKASERLDATSGVLQGSVLEPILFLITLIMGYVVRLQTSQITLSREMKLYQKQNVHSCKLT